MNPEAAAVKTLLYLGLMLLVGGAVCSRLLAPGLVDARAPRVLRLVRAGAVLGALLVMAGALLEVAASLRAVLGHVDVALLRRYLSSTAHGEFALIRLAVAPVTAALSLVLTLPRFRGARRGVSWLLDLVLVLLSGWLLYTFSSLSHAAAMGGAAPLWADFVHLAAAALWAGPLLYLSLLGGFAEARGAATAALERLSSVGLVAVLALLLTGTYNALTHAADPPTFAGSAYGWSLWVKLALFVLVLVAAARNRFSLLPRFVAGGSGGPLLTSLRVEAVLLLLVFVATGALTTASLPHGPDASTDPFVNLARVLRWLAP